MSKKAWLDLACWFKNKVWVGAWGLQYYFFYVSSLSWQEWEKKSHLNWCLLASLQLQGTEKPLGWRHKETQAWLLSLPHRARAEQSNQETAGRKAQRQQRAVAFGAVDISPVLQDSPGPWALSSGTQAEEGPCEF